MGEPVVERVKEEPLPGPVPRFGLASWAQRFGLAAGVTGRGEGPGRGFDLGLWTDAPVSEVMGRWRAFLGADPRFATAVLGTQVHGRGLAVHGPLPAGWTQVPGIDAHLSAEPGQLLLVTVADCVPVYLHHPGTGAVGLVHAGWRGAAAGVLSYTLQAMVEQYSAPASEIIMHCGVAICGDCYEVGSEVFDAFGMAVPPGGKGYLDVRARLIEEAWGLGLRRISTSQWCSGHDRAFFFSHRASRGADGRMVAYLGRPGRKGR